jgi:hypothetical protein
MLTDEAVLNTDAFVPFDPAGSLRARAQTFLASREWSTAQVSYGDQSEPDSGEPPLWSFAFALGLDHISKHRMECLADIEALIGFLQEVAKEFRCEVTVQVSYRSKPWHSEHIAFVTGEALDVKGITEMVQRVA